MEKSEHTENECDTTKEAPEESLLTKLKDARDFAEWMHELVDWQEGYIEIPWKDK